MSSRRCTKTGCNGSAVATLTYVYAESTAVLGPLAPDHVPGAYDLCRLHCEQLSVPRGWQVIRLPETYGLLSPIVFTVPLQLLAYHTALVRGTDVDKPRNLAKSVTVE